MGEIATQGTRVAIGASGASSAAGGVNVERDTYDFAPKVFINPFPLLVDDQSSRGSLVFSVKVLAAA